MFCIDCGKGGYRDLTVVVWFVGDSGVTLFPNLGHYDFAMSDCVGNNVTQRVKRGLGQSDDYFNNIVSKVYSAVVLSRWPVASEKALSFSDNEKLKPGHNDSKLYPGDIRVQCTEVPIPNTGPQVCTQSWFFLNRDAHDNTLPRRDF